MYISTRDLCSLLLLVQAINFAAGASLRSAPREAYRVRNNVLSQLQDAPNARRSSSTPRPSASPSINTIQDSCPHQCPLHNMKRSKKIELLRKKACSRILHYALVGEITNITDHYYTIDVIIAFKIGFVPIPTKGLKIMRTDQLNADTVPLHPRCACPKLLQGKKYLLTGIESISNHNLEIGLGDVTLRWKNRFQWSVESALVACSTDTISERWRASRSSFFPEESTDVA